VNQPAPSTARTASLRSTAPPPRRRGRPASNVPPRCRPSARRAAAAARLAGADPAAAARLAGAVAARTAAPGAGQSDPGPTGIPSRHLRAVPPPGDAPSRRRRARAILLAAAAVAAVVAFGLVYLHVVLAQRQFALDRLTSQVQAESTTYQNLRLEVAQLGSPQHIISTAEGQLGMHEPASVTYLTPTTSIGPPTSTPATSRSVPVAPSGDANWPQIKAQLAGSP
jgi:cell division protein FtsL